MNAWWMLRIIPILMALVMVGLIAGIIVSEIRNPPMTREEKCAELGMEYLSYAPSGLFGGHSVLTCYDSVTKEVVNIG